MQKICHYIDFNIANMQIICKLFAKNMLNMQQKYAKNAIDMQNMHKSMYWHILHIYIYMHSHFADDCTRIVALFLRFTPSSSDGSQTRLRAGRPLLARQPGLPVPGLRCQCSESNSGTPSCSLQVQACFGPSCLAPKTWPQGNRTRPACQVTRSHCP